MVLGVVIMSEQDQHRYDLVQQVLNGRLTIRELSTIIGKSYSQAKRIVKRVKQYGMVGIKHGNTNRMPWNKTPEPLLQDVLELLQNDYKEFNLTHFREMLQEKEDILIGKNVLHRLARKNQLVKRPKRRRKKVHKLRPRMPRAGMLVQFDGSRHKWFGGQEYDLIGGIDDATGEIVGLEFFHGETSINCMKVMKDIVTENGVPDAFYLDGAGYFGKHDRETNTQIGRALEELNCQCLIAGSPQAKGKIERLWNTLQDRLIAELGFYQITTIEDANKFLKEYFIPKFNTKFGYKAREKSSAYSVIERNLDDIFCKKTDRKIGLGGQFSYNGKLYVVKNLKYKCGTVWILEHIDGRTSYQIMHQDIEVEKYTPKRKNNIYPMAA